MTMSKQKFVASQCAGAGAVSAVSAPKALARPRRCSSTIAGALLLALAAGTAAGAFAAPQASSPRLAATPPMGWNDWAHYQCGFTAQTVLDNANALVTTGLAAAGYKTVVIDDCWMLKDRDRNGDLQPDPQRFPKGMKPIAEAVHKLGLNFGIYEDSGYLTCGGYAGSGEVKGGGRNYFEQDARLFASWGVDYLKLDGCNLYVPPGSTQEATYRKAYAEESAALRTVHRPIVFSESAPAYFQGSPQWYSVLEWVRDYGQLWREGSDIATFDPKDPDQSRFRSVMWNYTYNLPLGRFQKPGNWNDADFIIGGDRGMSLAETHSQMALWSMMSAPLILSSDVGQLSRQAIAILSNKSVIAIDQDPLGRTATLVSRTSKMDLLFKTLEGGDYAVAVLNRGDQPLPVDLHPADLGFSTGAKCHFAAQDLWSGARQSTATALAATVAAHDTAIWRIRPEPGCGMAARWGAIAKSNAKISNPTTHYTRCLASSGALEECAGTPAEKWTITRTGALQLGDRCLAVEAGKPVTAACHPGPAQHWRYTLLGQLVNDTSQQCLSARSAPDSSLGMEPCSSDKLEQIWSLPN